MACSVTINKVWHNTVTETPLSHADGRPLTSLTPAPCRQHCDLLVLMWSSAEVLEDESSPWWSGSLSLSSMEANTALSIQTDGQQNTEQGLLSLTPLSPGTSHRVWPVPLLVPSLQPVPEMLSCSWTSCELLLQHSLSSVNSSLPSMLMV